MSKSYFKINWRGRVIFKDMSTLHRYWQSAYNRGRMYEKYKQSNGVK